jgi:hypothetical protein
MEAAVIVFVVFYIAFSLLRFFIDMRWARQDAIEREKAFKQGQELIKHQSEIVEGIDQEREKEDEYRRKYLATLFTMAGIDEDEANRLIDKPVAEVLSLVAGEEEKDGDASAP